MATVTLRRLGGSVAMVLPKQILGLVHLDAGSRVSLSVEGNRLVVEPARKPKYNLADLLANCKKSDLAPGPNDRDWLDSPSAGKELL